MAATAKTSSSSSTTTKVRNFVEGQEDIESIRKQISDQAEVIYQTWKARGLPPSEFLNCSQKQSDQGVAELLAQSPDFSNNNLEKLVNSFVSEDKARIAAQRRSQSNSPTSGNGSSGGGGGSIAHVLKKFERSSSEPPPTNKPNYVRQSSQPPLSSSSSSSTPQQHSSSCNGLNTDVPDVLKDSIDKVLPKQKPQTPAKPEHLLNHVPTWPLKNRIVANNSVNTNSGGIPSKSGENGEQQIEKSDMVKKLVNSSGNVSSNSNNQQQNNNKKGPKSSSTVGQNQQNINNHNTKNSTTLLDEVTREEERLINALKTGIVLNNEPPASSLPEVITSTFTHTDSSSSLSPTNGIIMAAKTPSTENSENGATPTTANAAAAAAAQAALKLFNGVPAKPNHTPMFNVQVNQTNNNKGDAPFTINKVATTRVPLRPQLRELEESKSFQAKSNTPQPVRPFLSRGSVAERVLIFEKAPPERTPTERRASLKETTRTSKPLAVSQNFYYPFSFFFFI